MKWGKQKQEGRSLPVLQRSCVYFTHPTRMQKIRNKELCEMGQTPLSWDLTTKYSNTFEKLRQQF